MTQSANLIRARGLITFSNELAVPEGALVRAQNVNIDEQGVITQRRGLNDYGTSFGTSDDRLNQIMEYKDILFRHYGSTLQFDDGSGTFTSFTGTYSEIEEGFRLKYQESQGNFYFTSSDGIKKISALNNSDVVAGSIENAGIFKGYDITASTSLSATEFMPPESKVAYRVLFGKTDNNNNLLLGSPSERYVLTNVSTTDAANASVTFTLPDGITTDYFYRLYRTAPLEKGSLTLDEIDPGDEMNLVIENPISSSDISTGTITIADVTPDDFREGGEFLYTNAITGQGILQANEPPPIAKDVALFRNSMFYANTKGIHQKEMALLSVSAITAGTTELYISNGTKSTTYFFENAEDIANQEVIVSGLSSVGQAIAETAQSLTRVINRDSNGIVYAKYISGEGDLPGRIIFESRDLTDDTFYLSTNDSSMVTNFNPQLVEIETLSTVLFSSGSGSPAQITSAGHNLTSGDKVYINSPNTTPTINGLYEVTVVNANEFTIPVDITVEDNTGTNAYWFIPSNAQSDNLVSPNRLYWSKTKQPDAVPIVNFVDIGPKNEPIERILALRDNLFVFKTDGIYIVDGVTSPNFSFRLLESSTNIIAPDSAVVLNNQIYCLTTQGVSTVTETGVSIISRVIENKLLSITNSKFNYRLKTFGISYESDRSYILWLPTETNDTVATQCYRYNTFERAWTRWTVSATCGLVTEESDKLYLGDGSRNYMLEERKNFDRTDYADRNFDLSLGSSGITSNVVEFLDVSSLNVGDVLFQEQYITVAIFNRLLRKLDIDLGLDDTDYESTLVMDTGDSITDKLDLLNAKLLADDSSGTVTSRTFSTNWVTLRTEFNSLMDELNDNACDTIYKNYKKEESNTYKYESIITNINTTSKKITLSQEVPFLQADITIYKRIDTVIQWAPQHFGNPSVLKQIRESTIIFDQNAFYSAKMSYSSDLSGGFVEIPFFGKGIGYWGYGFWGNQNPTLYWGGLGNDAPFRTVVPREKQRCRYLNIKFDHFNARESYRILGISAVVRPLSTRAYR